MNGFATGLQHVGLPTCHMEQSLDFYRKLGFETIYSRQQDETDVHFLQLGNLVLELYFDPGAPGQVGAIEHLALDCADIEAAWDWAYGMGFQLLGDKIERLPFWQNGVRFFTIQGPNREKIEFCQRL